MKSILINLRPKVVAKTLNGEQTIIILKTAPKDWMDYLSGKTEKKPEPMTTYICCAKGKIGAWRVGDRTYFGKYVRPILNGKVVAKFTLREVEELYSVGNKNNGPLVFETKSDGIVQLYKRSCLDFVTLSNYLKPGKRAAWGYAWHISDLVIFDEPKELSDFMKPNWDDGLDKALEQARKEDAKIAERIHNGDSFDGEIDNCEELTLAGFKLSGRITKAPKSWCYVEESK